MKAATITSKPDMQLLKQTDIISFYHVQLPRWLFAEPQYRALSSDAKLAYALLLNRHQLSRINNWVNDNGEVFITYTREDLAAELGISYRKAIQCMQELAKARLVWERRCGRGDANQIYLAKVELSDEAAATYKSAPFVPSPPESAPARDADSAYLDEDEALDSSTDTDSPAPTRPADSAYLEDCDIPLTYDSVISRPAVSAPLDLQNLHPSNIDINKNKRKISPSVSPDKAISLLDGRADDADLADILGKCSLWVFPPETAAVFENAIERLYYSESYKICGAVLPQGRVRARLRQLDDQKLRDAEYKIYENTSQKIKNTTAYVMAVVFNSICEAESDIMSDPYLNSLKAANPNKGVPYVHPDTGPYQSAGYS